MFRGIYFIFFAVALMVPGQFLAADPRTAHASASGGFEFLGPGLRLGDLLPRSNFALANTALSLSNTQITQIENNLISVGAQLALDGPVSAGSSLGAAIEEEHQWSCSVEGFAVFGGSWDWLIPEQLDYWSAGATVTGSYRLSENLSVGAYGGYARTVGGYDYEWTLLKMNTGRFGIFSAWSPLEDSYLYGSLGGAVHTFDYPTGAHSNPTGTEFNSLFGGGYDFHFAGLSFGPQASLQYTYLNIGEFTERDAGFFSMRYREQQQNSLRTTIGGKAAYVFEIISGLSVEPSVRVAWQHEYLGGGTMEASYNRGATRYFKLTSSPAAQDTLLIVAGGALNIGDRVALLAYYTNSSAFDSQYLHSIQTGIQLYW